jgi:endoglucanase
MPQSPLRETVTEDKWLDYLSATGTTEEAKEAIEAYLNDDIIVNEATQPTPEPTPTEPTNPTPTPPVPTTIDMAVAGLEYAENTIPGTEGTNYFVNSLDLYKSLAADGFKRIRLPFITERLSKIYKSQIDLSIGRAESSGLKVWLDFHDYGRSIDLQSRVDMAMAYKGVDSVEAIEIDNEPHEGNVSERDWYAHAKRITEAMQSAGWNKIIGVPIYHWSSMDNFADKKLDLDPPVKGDNIRYIFHNYFNAGNTGFNHPAQPNEPADLHVQRLNYVEEWARRRGVKLAVTEFGVPATQEWIDNAKPFVEALKASDVVTHAFYWATGRGYTSQTAYKAIHKQLF